MTANSRYLTVRNMPRDLAEALAAEKSRRGSSLNRTVIELLAQALGVSPGPTRDNGLLRHAGTWTKEEFEGFEQAVAEFGEIDEEIWK